MPPRWYDRVSQPRLPGQIQGQTCEKIANLLPVTFGSANAMTLPIVEGELLQNRIVVCNGCVEHCLWMVIFD
jgi:hypothetical protein